MNVNRRNIIRLGGAGAAAAVTAPLAAGAASAAPLSPGGHGRHGDHSHGDHGHGIRNGADVAAGDHWKIFAGRRVGVITNPTGVLADNRSIVDHMVDSKVDVGAVFGPEHGFRGTAQAGESEGTTTDPRTGVTVYDAYGADVDKMVGFINKSKVDTIVFDIQDVGARYYTYTWTMWTAMQAAARVGLRFVVLDRPNPVGGQARGPVLRPEFTSGVGQLEISQQHGMSMGELARYFNATFLRREGLDPIKSLDVVRAREWRREIVGPREESSWIMPSPNMPTPQTALLYPGTGLFEATNLSEGRGTTRPFELIGAPYIDYQWAEALERKRIPGVAFRESYFVPTFSKNEGKVCGGVQVHILDAEKVDAIEVATHMLVELKRLYPKFDWRGDDGRWMNLLTGSGRFRKQLDAGKSAETIMAAWKSELREFVHDTRPYLLYPGRH